MERRSFLQAAAAWPVALGLTAGGAGPARARELRRGGQQRGGDGGGGGGGGGGRARNLIFMVADGMSLGTLTLADLVLKHERGRGSRWVELTTGGVAKRALMSTRSADGPVTDSAAGASAWGGGVKVFNGCINIDPEGRQRLPLLARAKQAGKAIGLVTTTRVTHATPAGFIANVPHRDMEDDIAEQMVVRGVDVALGGGAKFVTAARLERVAGVHAVRTAQELRGAPAAARLWGVFDKDHVPYGLDRGPETPGLAEMARAALARLTGLGEGFALQIEGGRVDHAAHNNDAAALIAEMIEFDETVAAVLEFIEHHPETLLVITTDHGNANPGLTLYGKAGQAALERLRRATRSFDWIAETLAGRAKGMEKGGAAWKDALGAVIAEATGVTLAGEECDLVAAAAQGKRVMPFRTNNSWHGTLGAVLADHFGVAFVSGNHTADHVELTMLGPGAEALPGWCENAEVHELVAHALGLPKGTLLPGMEQRVPVKAAADD